MPKRKVKDQSPQEILRALWAPLLLLVAAVVLAVLGEMGYAAGALLLAIGGALWSEGKRRRWKGAPQAGVVVGLFGVLVIVLVVIG